ncbi:hypothetical protein EC912_102563 [Luteibacter rhizovicinus]|uniref:DUF4340 domain-containing protein n=1 Tax=Luteibacter rhizovicinus TaxID=242606 RepID=A0A4R3YXZ9_9GAMM|nr:hypothetical protein [Luteibacter rhizovicinus]TCV96213.1 hypothetical protein EC912_102563 [Luteibacter rhizovicinus]
MNRELRLRLIGALGLFGLLAAVAWQWRADERDIREHTLLSIDPATVDRVDVAIKGLPPQHFERHDGRWSSDAALHDDVGRIEELASLAAAPVTTWKAASDFVPAKIGLSPPIAVLTLNDQRIEFGEMTALGKQRYAKVGDRIAFVPAQALPRAPRSASLPAQ